MNKKEILSLTFGIIFILLGLIVLSGGVSKLIDLSGMHLSMVVIAFASVFFFIIGGTSLLLFACFSVKTTLTSQSICDSLTGLFNRRYLEESLKREIVIAKRRSAPLAVIMIDVDHFKRINDVFGHESGDLALKALAELFQKNVRESDIVCRFGGEEFVLILPETSLDIAKIRAEELRVSVENLRISLSGGALYTVTVSLGIALYSEHGVTQEDLIYAADQAMYKAKQFGRNKTVVFEERVIYSAAV